MASEHVAFVMEPGASLPLSRIASVTIVVLAATLVATCVVLTPTSRAVLPTDVVTAPMVQSGIFVTFTCLHSNITLNTSSVCHDQSNVKVGFGGATGKVVWKRMAEVTDTGFVFTHWTTSGVCLGNGSNCSSSSNLTSIRIWSSCPLGQMCSGSVTTRWSPQYAITFSETGLASTIAWSVSLGGQKGTSSTQTIVFTETNGTYGYTIGNVQIYNSSPSSGSVSTYNASQATGQVQVAGSNVSVPVTYVRMTCVQCAESITIRVLGGVGQVALNGTNWNNGNVVRLVQGQNISITAVVSATSFLNTTWTFKQWLSDDGTFTNPRSTTTNFTVGSNVNHVGNLTLVLNSTSSASSWAGFIAQTTNASEISSVFSIPSFSWRPQTCENNLTAGCASDEEVSIWVGIGGMAGSILYNNQTYHPLWQAGFSLKVWYSGNVSACGWYEAYPHAAVYKSGYCAKSGATILDTVGFWSNNNTSWFSINDCNGGATCWWNGTMQFVPDRSTVEWIAETPCPQGSDKPGLILECTEGIPVVGGSVSFSAPIVMSSSGQSVSFVEPMGISTGFSGAKYNTAYLYVSALCATTASIKSN